MKKYLVLAGVVILMAGVFFVWNNQRHSGTNNIPIVETPTDALTNAHIAEPSSNGSAAATSIDWSKLSGDIYHCKEGKALKTELLDDAARVRLTLSDGRVLTLKNTKALYEGQEYKSEDGTIVLTTNPGGSATIEEKNVETYSGCVNSQG
jgi:hypothetical protein